MLTMTILPERMLVHIYYLAHDRLHILNKKQIGNNRERRKEEEEFLSHHLFLQSFFAHIFAAPANSSHSGKNGRRDKAETAVSA